MQRVIRLEPRPMVNAALKRAGVEVRLKPPAIVRSPHEMLVTFDLVAAHLASRTAGQVLKVVQVGAFDGQANDPVIDALQRFGWQGALVEPQPAPFADLQALHHANESVATFNVAISDQDGERDLFTVAPNPDLPDFAQQIASFNRSHLERQQRYVPDGVDLLSKIQATPVTTWTFDTLLRHAGFEEVDVLQIDAEGYDYELLRLFNVPERRPAIVGYEHEHLSRADRAAASELLVGEGYRLAMAGGDTIAYRT